MIEKEEVVQEEEIRANVIEEIILEIEIAEIIGKALGIVIEVEGMEERIGIVKKLAAIMMN